MTKRLLTLTLFLLFVLPMAGMNAHALTLPGTEIKNSASVTYSVGSVPYPAKKSNETVFKVLELIDAAVSWQDAANIIVRPGEIKSVMTFLVSSTGNGTETYSLTVNAGLALDDFDPALFGIYLDADNNGLFDVTLDTLYSLGSNDPILAPLASITVFVLCDIPGGLATEKVGEIKLTAHARTGTGEPGEILENLGDTGVDAMLGLSGGQPSATGGYQTLVTEYPLYLIKEGLGSVSSSPLTSIACDSSCSTQNAIYPAETIVTLTATPEAGQVFSGWTGACSGAITTCTVTMSEARTVKATFLSLSAPVGSIVINDGDEWTALHAVTLTLAASDVEGVAGWLTSEGATPPTPGDPGWQSVTATGTFSSKVDFTLSLGDGLKTVNIWYRDTDGNLSALASDTIKLDSTAPTTTATPPGTTFSTNSISIELSCTDGSGIGCAAIYYTVDGSIPTSTSSTYNGTLTFTDSTTLKFFSIDKLGNSEDVQTEEYVKEIVQYPLTLTKSGDGTITSVPVALNCGIECSTQTALFIDGTTVTLTAAPGAGQAFAGWSGACNGIAATCTVLMSETQNATATFTPSNLPSGTILINNGDEWTTQHAVTLTLAARDGEGIIGWLVSESSTPPTLNHPDWQNIATTLTLMTDTPFTLSAADGVKTVYAWYRDADGNISPTASDSIQIGEEPTINSAVRTISTNLFPYPLSGTLTDDQLQNIPGSYHQVELYIVNRRGALLDNTQLLISISNTATFCFDSSKIGTARYVNFIEKIPASGLLVDRVLFSNDGGLTFDYLPEANANHCDDAVTHIKVLTKGRFNPSDDTSDPSFALSFIARSKNLPAASPLNYATEMTYSVTGQMGSLQTLASTTIDELLDIATSWHETEPVKATAGDLNVVTTFKVSNLGNGKEAISLTLDTGETGDDFDPLYAAIWLDADGDGRLDSTKDTLYLPGSNEPLLDHDETIMVFVLCNIPADGSLVSGKEGVVKLTATAMTSGAGLGGSVFTGKGDAGTDAVIGNSGASSADNGIYQIVIATVRIAKTVKIVSDPFGNAPPLPLTGSVLHYTLTVTVDGGGKANNIVIRDRIPANTHYLVESLTLDGSPLSDAVDGDAGSSTEETVTVNLGDLSVTEKSVVTFEVTID